MNSRGKKLSCTLCGLNFSRMCRYKSHVLSNACSNKKSNLAKGIKGVMDDYRLICHSKQVNYLKSTDAVISPKNESKVQMFERDEISDSRETEPLTDILSNDGCENNQDNMSFKTSVNDKDSTSDENSLSNIIQTIDDLVETTARKLDMENLLESEKDAECQKTVSTKRSIMNLPVIISLPKHIPVNTTSECCSTSTILPESKSPESQKQTENNIKEFETSNVIKENIVNLDMSVDSSDKESDIDDPDNMDNSMCANLMLLANESTAARTEVDPRSVVESSYNFNCKFCGKAFKNNCYLERHTLVHTRETPFKCDICNKGFTQRGNLTAHTKTHFKDKPFQCHICNKSFPLKNGLKAHQLTHSDKKPYNCDVCGKGFTGNVFLRRHMLTHLNVKPFTCDVCDRRFTQKSNLQSHRLSHAENVESLRCRLCFRKFVNLAKHMDSVHGLASEKNIPQNSSCFSVLTGATSLPVTGDNS